MVGGSKTFLAGLLLNKASAQQCDRGELSPASAQLFSPTNPFSYSRFDEKMTGLSYEEADFEMRKWQMQAKTKQGIQRIVNGYDTPEGEAPYYVRVVQCTNGANCGYCGATWISQTTILTAAHCVDSLTTEMYYYLNPSNNAYNGAGAVVASWLTHECWDENASIWDDGFDIALLTVDNLADTVEVIRLAEPSDYSALPTGYPSNVNDFVSYGFGRTDGAGANGIPGVLQRTYGIEYLNCGLMVYATGSRDDVLCFKVANEHAICQGDSGGPRTRNGKQYALHSGFLSSGAVPNSVCSTNSDFLTSSPYSSTNIGLTGSMSFDTSVAEYIDWIKANSDFTTTGVLFFGEVDFCDLSPCANGGTCSSSYDFSSYTCACSSGFNGVNCETAIVATTTAEPEDQTTLPPITVAPGWPIIPTFNGPPGERTDPVSVTPPNPENTLEVVQQMILFIFEAYGITGITFIDGLFSGNSRRKRQLTGAEDALSAVQNYGCWCSKPFSGDAFKGKPLDEVDSLCKAYSMCTRCSKLNQCVGSDADSYSFTFVPATDTYTCVSASECGLNKCECTGQLGVALARSLIDNNFQLDAGNNNVLEAECQRVDGSSFNVACCGNVPEWKPYNTVTHQCVAGEITSQ